MPDIDFSLFGPYAITLSLLVVAVITLFNMWKNERNRNDELQRQRLEDAKETRDLIGGTLKEVATSTAKIYDAIRFNDKAV